MLNIQNEIKYRVAFGILKKLLDDGLLNHSEFTTAHCVVAKHYSPITVCQLP